MNWILGSSSGNRNGRKAKLQNTFISKFAQTNAKTLKVKLFVIIIILFYFPVSHSLVGPPSAFLVYSVYCLSPLLFCAPESIAIRCARESINKRLLIYYLSNSATPIAAMSHPTVRCWVFAGIDWPTNRDVAT